MFEEHNLQKLIQSAEALEATYNKNLETNYLVEAVSWSLANVKGPKPIAPFKVIVRADPATMQLVVTQSTAKVSALDAAALVVKHGTDVEGSDSPVGTPVPGSPGRYHVASWAKPVEGDLFPLDKPKYRYVHPPRSFFGYWEAI